MAQFKTIAALAIASVLLVLAATQTSPPQFQINNPVLGLVTSYSMSYYSLNAFTSQTSFTVNFNQTFLRIPDGTNNCSVRFGSSTIAPSPACTCLARVCTIRPSMSASANQSISIELQSITNPMFIFPQPITGNIYFSPVTNLTFNVTIGSERYSPMPIAINSVTQSDYGVGARTVNYLFNLSVSYISENMQIQVVIPNDINFENGVTTSLSFYSTIQNAAPIFLQSIIALNLQVATNTNPSGFMLLNLSGFGNPRFLGNSSSFRITFMQTRSMPNCSLCRIAEVSTGLQIQSRTPGDIVASEISSSNSFISMQTSLSFILQLNAGIPSGGKVSIYLPAEMKPITPIACSSSYGFEFSGGQMPTCSYNTVANSIETVNFATTIFDSKGTGIISVNLINPSDSRKVGFTFQTYDNLGRMIGKSKATASYAATPMPLSVNLTKTSQQIQRIFNLSAELTLSRSLNTSSDLIEAVLPPVSSYSLPDIRCFSAGQDLNCTKTLNAAQELSIRFTPPCVACSANNTIRFMITNLRNPSFINQANQVVVINTRTSSGVMESAQVKIPISPSILNLFLYSRPISRPVGSEYNLQIRLSLPDYVKTNGGQVHLVFGPMSTYVDGRVVDYNYQSSSNSIEVTTNTSSSILNNVVSYNYDQDLYYVTRIAFDVCDGVISVCRANDTNFTFIVRRLKLGYIPSAVTTDTIRATTKLGEVISESSVNTTSSSPVLMTSTLGMQVSRSMTNTLSDFQFKFTSTRVAFDPSLTFTLPLGMNINGPCSFASSLPIPASYTCTRSSSNSITITHDYNPNVMISSTITYTISIGNISTPVSVAPLVYTLDTTYNQSRNQRFTNRYAMSTALPLQYTYTKTNDTINQNYTLSIRVTPVTVQYDSWQLAITKTTTALTADWVPAYNLTQNATHYLLDRTGAVPNNTAELTARNSLSTADIPQYSVSLFQGGYLVQQAMIVHRANVPVVLGCRLLVSNRTVSLLADITVQCDRNSEGELREGYMVVELPGNGFNYSAARATGLTLNAGNPVLNITLAVNSPRVITATVSNVQNLNFVPTATANPIPNMQVSTLGQDGSMVLGRTTIPSFAFAPNDAYDIRAVTSTRSTNKSNELTNLTINYPTVLGTDQHVMQISLPQGQNVYTPGTSGCFLGAGLDPCTIISTNSTDILINLRPNATVLLTRLLNSYPNSNILGVRIYTSPDLQLVEQGYSPVTPPIALEPIDITPRASSARLATPNQLTLDIRPTQLKIQSNNIIKISLAARMFTRAYNTQDCTVRPSASGNTFTGCQFEVDAEGWLRAVTVGSFGPADVEVGAGLSVGFGVTNGWGAYPFTNKSIVVTVYKNATTTLSQGIVPLSDLYPGLSSFTLPQISTPKSAFTQSSLLAGAANTLTFTLAINGNIGPSTQLLCMLPKDTYIYPNSTASIGSTLQRQDSSYYYISIATACPNTGCTTFSQNFTLATRNAPFVKKQRNSIIIYGQYDSTQNTESYMLATGMQVPASAPGLTLTRNTTAAGDYVNVEAIFGLALGGSGEGFGQVTVALSANVTSLRVSSTSYAYAQGQPGAFLATGISVIRNTDTITAVLSPAQSSSTAIHRLSIQGRNALEVPIGPQQYWLSIQNTTHILYSSSALTFPVRLTPLDSGLLLTRSNATVGASTQLRLSGTLPQHQALNYSLFTLNIGSQAYPSLPLAQPLSPYTNPSTINNQPSLSITLCNATHCIYRQPATAITPALTPIVIRPQQVQINLTRNMTIGGSYVMTVNFTTPLVNKNYVRVVVDDRLYATVGACVGYLFNTSTGLYERVTDLVVAADKYTQGNTTRQSYTITARTRPLTITSFQLTLTASPYQLVLSDSPVQLLHEPPTSSLALLYNFTIMGQQIKAELNYTSNRINQLSNYTLLVEPITREGVLTVDLPRYVSELYDSVAVLAVLGVELGGTRVDLGAVSGVAVGAVQGLYLLAYDPTRKIYSLNFNQQAGAAPRALRVTLTNVANPPDNRPMHYTVTQYEPASALPLSKIYGYRQLLAQMTTLNPITVHLGLRNTTKIGAPIELSLDVDTHASPANWMLVRLPQSQVQVIANRTCNICVDGQCQSGLIGTPIDGNQVGISASAPGRHNYTISGCVVNSMFSQQPGPGDQIYVSLGTPYQVAETTSQSSVHITPLVSTGEIEMLGFTSSSNKRVDYTTLSLEIKPENWASCDGIMVKFGEMAYVVHANVVARLNGSLVPVQAINSSTLFIGVGDREAPIMRIEIVNVINYLTNEGFSISNYKKRTVTTTTDSNKLKSNAILFNPSEYGMTDYLFIAASGSSFVPYTPRTRIVFPNPYISPANTTIMAINDYNLPAQISTASVSYSFGSQELGCSQAGIPFAKTITINCAISQAGTINLSVNLFDARLSASALTSFTQAVYVYPTPKQHCGNALCDVCSDGPRGEYCFDCREGLFSENGQCVQKCQANTFAYADKTCVECAPSCSQCFDLYDNSCLECTNQLLLLDSGTCTSQCSSGYAYQSRFCVDGPECASAPGCRLCSPTGFCYDCLPEHDGEPQCKYSEVLPKNFFIFWMIPFVLVVPIVGIVTCAKVGTATLTHMIMYLLAVVELFSWVFTVPKLPQQALSMILVAFLLLKVVISIIAYETYYSRHITVRKQSKLIGEEEKQSEDKTENGAPDRKDQVKMESIQEEQTAITHKERLARFSAHFLCCDAYELLMSRFGEPLLKLKHYTPYLVLTMLNRVIVMAFLVYVIATAVSTGGDLVYVPILAVLAGSGIIFTRIANSDRFGALWVRIRS